MLRCMRCADSPVGARDAHDAAERLLPYRWSDCRGVHACGAGAAFPLRPGGLQADLTCDSYMPAFCLNDK